MAAAAAREHPRYEADERLPLLSSAGYGLQFSLIASATLLVTPVIVATAADRGNSYVTWMVFASLVVVGLSTIIQVRRLGFVGAGAVLPIFTAAFAIPFCITALVDGGPATLTTLVVVSAIVQLVVSRWLFILRRFVTPTVSGTVMMILSITLASVVFDLLDEATKADPEEASLTAIAIQANGATIGMQRVAWRDDRAVDFRQVQGSVAGAGASNLFAGLAGTVPNAVNPAIIPFIQITSVAARRMGYSIGLILLLVAFLPKVSAVLSSIPGPVMTGYLIIITGALFVDGARTVIQNEASQEKIAIAGVCFWIAASFQFELFTLPDVGRAGNALLKSGITTGGLAAIAMILYLELTNPRRMRFRSQLHVDALPDLNAFITRFAQRRGWDQPMQDRLSAVAEETLLTLAPLDLSLGDESEEPEEVRQLVVLASSEGEVADLEFIGGGENSNLEDQIRQIQEHDSLAAAEEELSLVLLRSYTESVEHQQYHGTDIITVRVAPP